METSVKIDTKEKFSVLTPTEKEMSVIMTAQTTELLLSYLQKDTPHIVLNLQYVESIDEHTGELLASIQQKFYESNCSFVICCLQNNVENTLDNHELLEIMNVTPSESEAWDIVQMEEIERELLGDE
jgi:anti-anti-sigma factor